MPKRRAPPPRSVPCDSCPSQKFCARSRWTCEAFERFVIGRRWKPQQRQPSARDTRRAIEDRQRHLEAERTESRRARERATLNAWRARNLEHVRALRRASMNAWYQRIRTDPEKFGALRASHERWRAKNPDKVREYNRRWREKNRDRIRAKAREKLAAQHAERAAAREAPAAAGLQSEGPRALQG